MNKTLKFFVQTMFCDVIKKETDLNLDEVFEAIRRYATKKVNFSQNQSKFCPEQKPRLIFILSALENHCLPRFDSQD